MVRNILLRQNTITGYMGNDLGPHSMPVSLLPAWRIVRLQFAAFYCKRGPSLRLRMRYVLQFSRTPSISARNT